MRLVGIWRMGFVLFVALLLTGCASDKAPPLPESTLMAPTGHGFVLEDAAGRRQLSPTVKLTTTPTGLLIAEESQATIIGPITIPPEARLLRVNTDGSVTVRYSDQGTYRVIGQLQLGHWRGGALSTSGPDEMLTGKPGSTGFPELTQAMYAITRQGATVRLVLVEYGGGE